MKIEHDLRMNKNGMKVIYKSDNHQWYGEFTKSDYKNDYSWRQWGEDAEYLGKTVEATEYFTNQWIANYGG